MICDKSLVKKILMTLPSFSVSEVIANDGYVIGVREPAKIVGISPR